MHHHEYTRLPIHHRPQFISHKRLSYSRRSKPHSIPVPPPKHQRRRRIPHVLSTTSLDIARPRNLTRDKHLQTATTVPTSGANPILQPRSRRPHHPPTYPQPWPQSVRAPQSYTLQRLRFILSLRLHRPDPPLLKPPRDKNVSEIAGLALS